MSIRIDKVLINITDTGHSYIVATDFISKIDLSEYIKARSEANERKCKFFSSYILEHQCSLFKLTMDFDYSMRQEGKLTKPYKTELIDEFKNIMISDGYVLSIMDHENKEIKNLCLLRIILDTTEAEIKIGIV